MSERYHETTAVAVLSATRKAQDGNCLIPLEVACAAGTYLLAQEDFIADGHRMDWLESQCAGHSVQLLINGKPRGVGRNVRDAIDDAIINTPPATPAEESEARA